jgi:competence protein ComEA
MATANERRALWFLAIVALSGSAVRLVRARSARPATGIVDAQLERQLGRVDSVRDRRAASKTRETTRAAGGRDARPPSRSRAEHPAPVDLDRASAGEIEALPGIGPALSARIVAHRDSAGLIGSMAGLCRVRGVGPAMAARLRPLVVFSGVPAGTDLCEARPARPSKARVTNRGKPR